MASKRKVGKCYSREMLVTMITRLLIISSGVLDKVYTGELNIAAIDI